MKGGVRSMVENVGGMKGNELKMRILLTAMLFQVGLLGLSAPALCENPQICQLAESVVEEMSFQLSADGRLESTTLINSAAFLERCPGTVMQSFNRFAIDKEALHIAWIAALEADGSVGRRSDLDTLLAAAHRRVLFENSKPLEEFLDDIFDKSSRSPGRYSSSLDHVFEQQASSTLIQFSHCDAAEMLRHLRHPSLPS